MRTKRSERSGKVVIKHWISYLLKIPQTFVVSYEKCGIKYLKIVRCVGKKRTEKIYQVEHLLDDNLQVTEQTLEMEKKIFVKVSSNK